MKNLTALFIRRPVLSLVVSAIILVLGLRAMGSLPVLEYPKTENATITITTTYPGADPNTMAGFVTTPIENAVAQVNGIDYITSSSQTGISTITINLVLNYNPDKALTEIQAQIQSVLNQLPSGTQQPQLKLQVGQTLDAMYIGFKSSVLTPSQITDYLVRVVQPQLQSVQGVQTAEILGAQNFAMRIWLDPNKLAAYHLTASDVYTALAGNDFISALGNTKGQMTQTTLTASTSLHSAAEFRQLIVSQSSGQLVRLGDVATVKLGSYTYEANVAFDGKTGVYIGIQVAPNANLLSVIKGVQQRFPAIQAALPQGLQGTIVYNSAKFVTASISDVIAALIEALLIVVAVVFAFLGTPRSVIIPVVAIPLSLIGTFAAMLILGFTINLLTLLALVLAIGLVVDDAIIVVENINRHLADGESRFEAARNAAAELANPIIAMTVVLAAVYVPIGFQTGLTGALFTEFAFTLVSAVTISAIIALTLTPMLSSKLLRAIGPDDAGWEGRLVGSIDRSFDRVRLFYMRLLRSALQTVPIILMFGAIVLGSIYFLASSAKSELAPQEDQGVVILASTAAPNSTLQQRVIYAHELNKLMFSHKSTDHTFQINTPTISIAGMVLKPWDQRAKNASVLQTEIQNQASAGIPGEQIAAFQPPSLPGSQGLPVQFVIKTTNNFQQLNTVSQKLLQAALSTGDFIFLQTDLKIDQPQATVEIDRAKAANLGLTMSDVGAALSRALGGGYVNYFSLDNRSYEVIPQVAQKFRLNSEQVLGYPVATVNGVSIPLGSIAHIAHIVIPESVNHFQQLNSATIQGVVAPGVAEGTALKVLDGLAAKNLPSGYAVDYGGAMRQFVQERSGFLATFGFAVIVIFLALAALFNSFRDPLIILVSVPMSIFGAMLFINLGFGGLSINIYTEVGLVTLMGLISKHGILIVEVANEAQRDGMSKLEAIEHAVNIRLRPILMTTAAMVLGVVPLILASGAGAAARFNMGAVIAAGLSIGTLFTLFVLPAVYLVVAEQHQEGREAAIE